MRFPRALFASALASVVALAAGCSGGDGGDVGEDEGEVKQGEIGLCAAVRGNGELIGAHFQSLAHVVETYGVVDGMAGGSSGSITTFLYESVLMNPAVSTCGTTKCTAKQRSARVALAVKSLLGYGETVAKSPEAETVFDSVAVVKKIQSEAQSKGALALASPSNVSDIASKLQGVLSIPEVKEIVNPEIFDMLKDVRHLTFNVGEIQTSIKTLGAFSVDQNRLFFRPGLLNWKTLAMLFGRVGDFYAGNAPADSDAFGDWLDACADKTLGMPWDEAAQVDTGAGSCGDQLGKLVTDYRAKVRAPGAAAPKRLSDRVGGPLHKLISTSVLEGDAVRQYETARTEYLAAKYPTGAIASFKPAFDDIHFGYWGSDADLTRLDKNTSGFADEKTQKRTLLGSTATWGEILAASPAEPGLSRFVKLADGRYSAGGWSDLAPVLALKNIGCKRVVYLQRQGEESKFAAQIAVQLGMDEASWHALYDLANKESSYSVSVAKADGVWCTNWNAFTAMQQQELEMDAYNAPLELRGLASVKALRPYSKATKSPLGIAGCSAGAHGTQSWSDIVGAQSK